MQLKIVKLLNFELRDTCYKMLGTAEYGKDRARSTQIKCLLN